MKIVTWNINGIKARLNGLSTYLKETSPDVICLQEIKSVDEGFPGQAFEDLGYTVTTHGQKGFNGVAILSKTQPEDIQVGLPGDDEDIQARYLEATLIEGNNAVRLASLYLPNGNPIDTERFPYKLGWIARLNAHAATLLNGEMPTVLAGDYNVIPQPLDAKRPKAWTNDALFQPESRSAFRQLTNAGWTDYLRTCQPDTPEYTFWDYQAGAWQKDNGIRIDHLLLSPQAVDVAHGCGVDRFTRGWEKPSDHVPVWVELNFA